MTQALQDLRPNTLPARSEVWMETLSYLIHQDTYIPEKPFSEFLLELQGKILKSGHRIEEILDEDSFCGAVQSALNEYDRRCLKTLLDSRNNSLHGRVFS